MVKGITRGTRRGTEVCGARSIVCGGEGLRDSLDRDGTQRDICAEIHRIRRGWTPRMLQPRVRAMLLLILLSHLTALGSALDLSSYGTALPTGNLPCLYFHFYYETLNNFQVKLDLLLTPNRLLGLVNLSKGPRLSSLYIDYHLLPVKYSPESLLNLLRI